MRVSVPRIEQTGDEVVVRAAVEVEKARVELPREMTFAFPAQYAEAVVDRLDGFASALLPLAMTLGEDLHLDGAVSPKLLHGLEEYGRVQCAWRPSSFQPVGVTAERLETPRLDGEGAVASSFSGGVDSAFTLRRHLPEQEPNPRYRVSHALMINGFDADTDSGGDGHFARIREATEPMMRELGVQLVVCRTNYRGFSDPDILKQSFSALLAAPALVLGRLLSVFMIPASYRFHDFLRDGSHLVMDHLLSTETMETVHDGSELMRPEKTAIVGDWKPAYSTLRVCFHATGTRVQDDGAIGIRNCGRCEKCIRTMKSLELCDRLDRFETFDRRPTHVDVWFSHYGSQGARLHGREILLQAWRARRFGTWFDYLVAIAISFVVKVPRDLLRRLHLFAEARSATYARGIRRVFPRLHRQARWIK